MVKLTPPSTIAQQVGVQKRKVPTAPIISQEELVGKYKQEFIKTETAKVNRIISGYENDIKGYQQRQKALEGVKGGRAKWNQLDNDISFARRQIRGLQHGKKFISQGAGSGDVTSYAVAKASAELANIAAAKQTTQYDFSKVKAGEVTYIKEFDTYYTRDPSGKLRVTSGERGYDWMAEKIETKWEKPGQQKVETGWGNMKPTSDSYFKPSEETYIPSMRMFARPSEISGQATALFRSPTIEEQRKIDLTVGEKTEAIETKWFGPKRKLTREEYEKLRFKPIPMEERPWFAPSKVKEWFGVGAEYTFRAGEKGADIFQQTGLIKTDSKWLEPTGITREGAVGLISDIYMFGGFGRFMRTGTAQRMESQYAGEVVEVIYKGKKVRMTKAEAKSRGLIKDIGTRQQALGEFGRLSEAGQMKILRRAFIKKREGVFYLDRATKEAAIIKDIQLAKNFMREAGLSESKITSRINVLFPKMGQEQMFIIKSTGKFKPQIQKEWDWKKGKFKPRSVGQLEKFKLKLKPEKQQLFFKEFQTPRGVQLKKVAAVESAVVAPSRLKFISSTAFKQVLKQDTKLDIKQEIIPKRKPVFKIPTPTKMIQPLRMGRFPGRGVSRLPAPKILKKPKLKLWFGLPGLALPIGKKNGQGYIPQAKTKGGKWKDLSRKPMSRGSALSRGARATDQTLSAQFRIRKTKGKITNGYDNYFGVTQRKYRPYKIRKGKAIELHNQFIEKRGSRIDTRGEKRDLKLSKFIKQQGWMRQKKKVKTKSQWLV